MRFIFLFFWIIVFLKKLFFWAWLWQLKEYHLGRIKAHFSTFKGRKIITNPLFFLKAILFFGLLLFFDFSLYLLVLLFSLESVIILRHIVNNNFRIPVLTKKTILILGSGLFLGLLIIILALSVEGPSFYIFLLVFDVLAAIVFSVVVFVFEIITMIWRKNIIKKATRKREKFDNLLVIGITGSYGKTSTKEFLFQILSQKFKVLKTSKHQNSEVGVSRSILNNLKPEHEIFICEMGAYNKGGIKLLAGMAKPKIGILTGLNEQHLATFGSFENIKKAKYELIESLPEDGFAVFNGENEHCKDLYNKTEIEKILARKEKHIENLKVDKEYISFSIKEGERTVPFRVDLLGEYWVEDLLMAILTARKIGMGLEEISEACKKIEPIPGAMKLIKKNNLNLLDATYSANFNGVIAHLEHLNKWSGRKIIIMPCLIELGKESKRIHKSIGEKIGEVCNFAIVTTKECFNEIQEGATMSEKEKNVLFINDSEEIFKKINDFSKDEDIILLESRVPKKLLKKLELE
jgi:UDP-N-acetylmuramoyl-tripeptide--D-alanyl-D-alanine ligase